MKKLPIWSQLMLLAASFLLLVISLQFVEGPRLTTWPAHGEEIRTASWAESTKPGGPVVDNPPLAREVELASNYVGLASETQPAQNGLTQTVELKATPQEEVDPTQTSSGRVQLRDTLELSRLVKPGPGREFVPGRWMDTIELNHFTRGAGPAQRGVISGRFTD
jgi:hypothetical protein